MTQSSRAVPETGVVEELRQAEQIFMEDEAAQYAGALFGRAADALSSARVLARRLSDALLEVRPLGGSELFQRVGDEYYADPKACGAAIGQLRSDLHNAKTAEIKAKRRATTAERERDEAMAALRAARKVMRNAWGAVTSDQVVDKQVDKMLRKGWEAADAVLSSVQPVSGSREQRGNEEG